MALIRKFDSIFERHAKNKHIHEAVLLVENMNGDVSYSNGHGGKDIDAPILMASVTKLFTTAIILILKEQGKLSLDDPVTTYFQEDTLESLHMYKGKDYSRTLTLYHLLFQTSGLPDVFEEGSHNMKKRAIHKDMAYQFDDVITMTKQLRPHFAPNVNKRAYYADVNFDMLGNIIETVTHLSLEDAYKQYIFDPLALKRTYLPKNDDDFIPNLYFKDQVLYRPDYIRSCRASGGGVSTVRELMLFIKAFFGGRLFNQAVFRELAISHRLQFSMYPIHYSAGYMRVPLSGLASFFTGKGELLGHSGSTGSFAFYFPEKDLFFVGDVNQTAHPALPVRLAMQLAISAASR